MPAASTPSRDLVRNNLPLFHRPPWMPSDATSEILRPPLRFGLLTYFFSDVSSTIDRRYRWLNFSQQMATPKES